MALLPGSPAIDAGSVALAVDANGNPLTTDQRGDPRIVDGNVDIGAFEGQEESTTTTVTASPATSVSGQSVTFTATVTPQSGSAIPTATGSIQFEIDGSDFGSPVALVNGSATSAAISSLSVASHTISAVYTSNSADFVASTGSTSVTVETANEANIQSVVNNAPSSSGGSVTIQTTSNTAVSTAVQAVNAATPSSPVTVTLDLGGANATSSTAIDAPSSVQLDLTSSSGSATVSDATVTSGTVIVAASVAPVDWTVNGGNVTVEGSATAGDFIVNGGTVTLADGTVITGNSPAVTLNGGTVILQGVTAQTATNAPTILVNGGSLIVRNSTIEESTGYAEAAILITGGSVDLGTAASPGDNVINVNGTGELVHNATSSSVPDIGNTLEVNGTPLASPYLSFTALASSSCFLGLRPVRDLDRRSPRRQFQRWHTQWRSDFPRHDHRRQSRIGLGYERCRHARHLGARGRQPHDHGRLRWEQQLRLQPQHLDPNGSTGQHDDQRYLVGEHGELRPSRDLHGQGRRQRTRLGHAHRHRRLLSTRRPAPT